MEMQHVFMMRKSITILVVEKQEIIKGGMTGLQSKFQNQSNIKIGHVDPAPCEN